MRNSRDKFAARHAIQELIDEGLLEWRLKDAAFLSGLDGRESLALAIEGALDGTAYLPALGSVPLNEIVLKATDLLLSTPLPDVLGTDSTNAESVAHSTDFRSVQWFGTKYSFTANQAPVVRLLHENWKARTPDVGDETLLNAVDPMAPPERLGTLFRSHPAWGTMIVAGGTRGTHRLDGRVEENL